MVAWSLPRAPRRTSQPPRNARTLLAAGCISANDFRQSSAHGQLSFRGLRCKRLLLPGKDYATSARAVRLDTAKRSEQLLGLQERHDSAPTSDFGSTATIASRLTVRSDLSSSRLTPRFYRTYLLS